MKLYGLKTCDTCRKALKILKNAEFIDVREQGVPSDVMARAIAAFSGDIVNTRSTTWRGLGESERAKPAATLLEQHPPLMKRPLIEDGENLYLGWNAQTQAALGVG
ncbi:MAG: ArsC/Spx/MgsR family protein [Pseudomonadota bacterium]